MPESRYKTFKERRPHMTRSTKYSLIVMAVMIMSAFGSGVCMAADEFGARFTNVAPAALAGEPVVDNMAVAQDEPVVEGLNEIAPAAGDAVDAPKTEAPSSSGDNSSKILDLSE
jgi:hypothetical protein